MRFFAFVISVLSSSAAVAFAAFSGEYYLLAVVLIPCILAFSLSIIPTGIPARIMMILGLISFLVSVAVIVYVLVYDSQSVKPYIDFLYEG
jgi:hypothetical protein